MCGLLTQKEEGEAGHLFSKFSLTLLRQSFKDKLTGVLHNASSCMICGRPVDGIVLLVTTFPRDFRMRVFAWAVGIALALCWVCVHY